MRKAQLATENNIRTYSDGNRNFGTGLQLTGKDGLSSCMSTALGPAGLKQVSDLLESSSKANLHRISNGK